MGSDLQVVRCVIRSTFSTLPVSPWCLLSPHLHTIPHLHPLKNTILILDRQMWGATVSTRTPTATWSKRSCSRTSASPTLRGLATHRTRSHVQPRPSRTALEL